MVQDPPQHHLFALASSTMVTTPKKRRKLNDASQSSPSRKLEFFFNAQQARKSHANEPKGFENATADHSSLEPSADHVQEEQRLTDEQLARKLQAEWDKELESSHSAQYGARHVNGGQEPSTAQDEETMKTSDERSSLSPGLKPEGNPGEDLPPSPNRPVQKSAGFLKLQSTSGQEETISYSIPLDESPLTFDPQQHLPALRKQWQESGGNSTYALLTHGFVLIGSTTSRIKIVDTLTNLLRTLIEGDPASLLSAVWLATNGISPPYIDLELGLGGSAISKALIRVCGLDNASLKTLYNKHGDAGDVAFEAKKRQSFALRKPNPLTIKFVYDSLLKIAHAKGQGSQQTKQRIAERLVQDARGAEESRYIVRTLVQHLRIGAVKTTMLIALSRAFLLSRPPGADFPIKVAADLRKLSKQELAEAYKPGEELVKASFARRPNYNDLVPTLLELGVLRPDELLLRCGLSLHIPLRPMLGGITRDLNEMLLRLEGRDFACEYKYDGQRAQVHCDDAGKVTIFSRHLEVMTTKYPDLVAIVPQIRGESVQSFILEGEVVAVDRESGDLKPFQILSNRARKDVVVHEVKVNVCLFAFDLMYLNGESLLDRPFRERRSLLKSLFVEIPNHFTYVESLDATSEDVDAISAFFKGAIDIKCEGIMVKVLDSPSESADPDAKPSSRRKPLPSTYTPDKRLDSWLKVKKDYNNATTDTLDLVPVGAWHGQGRKNKWWSPVLLACRNEDDGSLEVVTKCISGFTDTFYKEMRAKYDPADTESGNIVSRPPLITYEGPEPDVWFNPQEVWELVFADITLSPTYTAAQGIVHESRGLSTRFPRFLKVREDKGIDEASTNYFLAQLYRKQSAKVTINEDADMDSD